MKVLETKIPGVYIIEADHFQDVRGSLTKTLHKDTFEKYNLNYNFEESFFSISKKDVIRGMHFQIPPQDHSKLVHVPHGAIRDVILDIRKGSPTYGEFIEVELSAENYMMVYIPKGCAHGFISLVDNSNTTYLQSTVRSAEHEGGIQVNSFGVNWQTDNPILSDRDKTFPNFKDYDSPFVYHK